MRPKWICPALLFILAGTGLAILAREFFRDVSPITRVMYVNELDSVYDVLDEVGIHFDDSNASSVLVAIYHKTYRDLSYVIICLPKQLEAVVGSSDDAPSMAGVLLNVERALVVLPKWGEFEIDGSERWVTSRANVSAYIISDGDAKIGVVIVDE